MNEKFYYPTELDKLLFTIRKFRANFFVQSAFYVDSHTLLIYSYTCRYMDAIAAMLRMLDIYS